MHLRRAVLASCCMLAVGTPTAAALPPDRAYELVSPYHAGQGDVFGAFGFPDGEHAAFASFGFVEGHPSGVMGNYLVERTPAGWVTRPTGPAGDRERSYQLVDGTDDASRVFFQAIGGLLGSTAQPLFQQLDPDGTRTDLVSFPLASLTMWAGRSADGSRSFVYSNADFTDEYATPESQLYEVTGGDVELVGRDEAGDPLECGASLASGQFISGMGRSLGQNGISADARTIAYITPGSPGPGCAAPPPDTLYVARDGDAVAVSLPADPAQNQPATFLGMDPAGTVVYFLTAAPLEAADANGAGDIYAYTVASGDLERITAGPPGDDDASVLSGVVSADGSHIYFTAENAIDGQGTDASVNLFRWTEDGIEFVVTSPGMPPLGGNGMVTASGSFPTPDGRHLLFWSPDKLTEHDNEAADGTAVQQVFQYSEADGEIRCVTCHPDPTVKPSNAWGRALGGANASGLSGQRVQSDDGRSVVFVSPQPLLPGDRNSKLDLYEWRRDGGLYLISTGVGVEDVYPAGISADGRDIFFATSERLVPGLDQDNVKLYDARVGGGLPAPQTPAKPSCSGDECQGTPSPRPRAVVPGSATLDGPGNVSEAEEALRVRAIGRKALRRAARTGRLQLSVTVAQPGRVTASLRAKLPGKGRRTIASTARTVEEPGRARLTLRLSKAARRALGDRSLRAALRVTAPGADPDTRELALPRR